MQTLPEDIVRYILDYIEELDVRRIALVARDLRAIAINHPTFVLTCNIQFRSLRDIENHQDSLDRLDYILLSQLPLRLIVRDAVYDDISRDFMQNHVGSRLLPSMHLLVRLEVRAHISVLELMQDTLSGCAPSLRSLIISNESHTESDFELSPSFLKDGAPRLFYVRISYIWLGNTPLPAFAHVQKVVLRYSGRTPPLKVPVHFPSAKFVRILFNRHMGQEGNLAIDMRGHNACTNLDFELDFLFPFEQDLLTIAGLPTISWAITDRYFVFFNINWILADVTIGPVAVHEYMSDNFRVLSIRNPDGIQRKICTLRYVPLLAHPESTPLFLIDAEGVPRSDRITDLRITCNLVGRWTAFSSFYIVLPAMKRLQIDVDGSDWHLQGSNVSIRCEQLREVLLVAHHRGTSIRLDLDDAISLGKVLAQGSRLPAERAALKIYGLSWDKDPAGLEAFFSSVEMQDYDSRWRANMLDLSNN